jgi:ATP synthase F1 complex assembly factor 2
VSQSSKYYCVTLDDRVTGTLYKDVLALPSRALAIAVAEEWDAQTDKIDMKTLKLNAIIAKAIRSARDPSLQAYMRDHLYTLLENDQICFQEDPLSTSEYKSKLAVKQAALMQPVRDYMRQKFEVNLKVWYNVRLDEQDKSVSNIVPIIEAMDPYVLNSVYHAACASKSASIALMLVFTALEHNSYSIEDAVRVARVDEEHQQSVYGVVEGAHDLDHANMLSMLATAKSVVSLAATRDF